MKKEMGKWCEFHKSSTHNTSECQAKQSLVADMRASESNACYEFELEPDKGNEKGKQIIDTDPNATVNTANIQKEELEDPEGGTGRSSGGGASLPLLDVGKGFPAIVHCQQWEPKEPHFSRGSEAFGLDDHNTPTTVHHRVASPRTGSLRQPTVSPSLKHRALYR